VTYDRGVRMRKAMYVALRGKGGAVQGFECLKLVFRANGLDMPRTPGSG
jgi:hypothetical protein